MKNKKIGIILIILASILFIVSLVFYLINIETYNDASWGFGYKSNKYAMVGMVLGLGMIFLGIRFIVNNSQKVQNQ